ncbi:MAG: hypothetical protein FWB71_05390 [Defluviitaleaceae bacterium]|nr:hypothetical protein [Defluviitaleaceae bacterium]
MENKNTNPDCPCANLECERRTDCDTCMAAHEKAGKPTACQRAAEGEAKA